jgi:hypothetical protein
MGNNKIKAKCTNINAVLSNDINVYFEDEKGNNYYWWTKSNKAFENLYIGTEIEITSCKLCEAFSANGKLYRVIKNVRFKLNNEEKR